MKILQKLLVLMFFLLLLNSCTREFTLDTETTKSQIVVNSLVTNKNNMEVTVTQSFPVSGDVELNELVDAQVSIFKEDVYLEDLTYSKSAEDVIGKFSTSFITEPTKKYRIEVSHPDFDEVQATTYVPQGVDIANAAAKFVGGNAFNFSFDLRDSEVTDYYYLKMYFRGYVIDTLTQTRNYLINERIEIPVTAVPDGQRYLDNGYIFKDDTFGGNENTIAGVAKYSRIPNEAHEEIITDSSSLFIQLETLTEDAYKYYKSNATYLNLFTVDIFGEATTLYGNVENGLGIFAGVYVSEVEVSVEF
ncbi:MAG: DUF4249 domain-containing protein [Saprospiraceae bacterium]